MMDNLIYGVDVVLNGSVQWRLMRRTSDLTQNYLCAANYSEFALKGHGLIAELLDVTTH